jgi:hypothetical protein
MKHDPELDTQLTSAIRVLQDVDRLKEEANRIHGSIGVINSVLTTLSISDQLTQAQQGQIHDLMDTWHAVLYPHLTKKPTV